MGVFWEVASLPVPSTPQRLFVYEGGVVENYRIKHLWICGVRAIHNNVDTLVQNADLVLVRGEQACRWLELIDIDTQKVKKVQVNYDHNRSSHKLEILQPDIQNTNTLLYVTQVSPPSADLIAM